MPLLLIAYLPNTAIITRLSDKKAHHKNETLLNLDNNSYSVILYMKTKPTTKLVDPIVL